MENEIARAVERYDSRQMTRRELVAHLATLTAVFAATGRAPVLALIGQKK